MSRSRAGEVIMRPVYVGADEFRHANFVMVNLKGKDAVMRMALLTPDEADDLARKLTWRAARVRARLAKAVRA